MRLACYLTDKTPPRRYVTSARAVVSDGDCVLVVQDPSNRHIMPGGRLEPNETPEDALHLAGLGIDVLDLPQGHVAGQFVSPPAK